LKNKRWYGQRMSGRTGSSADRWVIMFSKILVANRAEIAVRVLRTCRELGVIGVAVHSDPDAGSLHARIADERVALPGATAADTYLDQKAVIQAALETGCEAVHPGYGFLAENAGFAGAVTEAGLVFIGPPAAAIDVMGDKVAARAVAARAGVPQVPGTDAITAASDVVEFGDRHGYPIAIKASFGGGGRGMRTVTSAAGAVEAFDAARRESGAAFGRDEVYVERYLAGARHVEVQVFADNHRNVVWLGDRDCSVQRRHQKVVEEAPAPGLSDDLRWAMGEASVRLARAVDYRGAGTVEFLVEADREAFYFLEMNTRIQVEHPVTELTLGLDLVAEQLRVASGERLSIEASGPAPRGHAIEVRVNAEDVAGGLFRPSPGPVVQLDVPHRAGVRFDAGYAAGDEILPYYDSLVGKLVVWAPTREHAIDRLLLTISETRVAGVPTTLPAATLVLDHPAFRAGGVTTRWLEHDLHLERSLPAFPQTAADDEATAEVFDRQDVYVAGRSYRIARPLPAVLAAGAVAGAGILVAEPGEARPGRSGGRPRAARRKAAASGTVTSPMQGTVVTVHCAVGDAVEEGQVLLVLEAMKMENPVRAAVAGTVAAVSARVGAVVSAGTPLVEITPTVG
jgi:acetyl-CoA/propionyl-CoA carboxylase biotin carboxyl carrier protein